MPLTHPWTLVAVAACSVALAGPVAAWTRRYVRKSREDYTGEIAFETVSDPESNVRTPIRGDDDRRRRVPGPSAHPPVRHPGLLATVPQVAITLVLCGFCVWWGMTAEAVSAALVAVPVYALLASAASVDAVAHLLPNRLLGSTAIWLAFCGTAAVVAQPSRTHAALRALLWALIAAVISLLLTLLRTGLGLGDVKLCTIIGLWLGWFGGSMLALGLCAGIALGGLGAVVLLATHRAGRKDSMAYGPYLTAGAMIVWPLAIV